MARKGDSIPAKLDWVTVGLFIVLLLCGWLSVCSAGYNFEDALVLNFSTRAGKQLIWILCAFVIAFCVMLPNQNFYRSYSYVFYVIMVLLLILTIIIARDTKGSRSWIHLGPVSIQPAEFAKFATALALARFLDNWGLDSGRFKSMLKVSLFFLIPLLLIIAQKETGSALVYLAFFLVLYREGMSGMYLFSAFCAVLFFIIGIKYWELPFANMPFTTGPFIVLLLIQLFTALVVRFYAEDERTSLIMLCSGVGVTALGLVVSFFVMPFNVVWLQLASIVAMTVILLIQVTKNVLTRCIVPIVFAVVSTIYLFSCNFVFDRVLQPHQQTRINIILGLEEDPFGAGYNVNQSMIAIGSGGFWGKGFLKGTQTKLKYVPEQDTDFIFCTIGEEQGFKGTAFVLIVYLFFILRLVWLAERQSSVFGRVLGYSTASIFLFHLFINIGMVLGITPVIGIPLPFFSYGGSSLWGFTILLFIFLRIDAERTSRF